MKEITEGKVLKAASPYTKLFLSLYDFAALGFGLRFIWGCPSHKLVQLYNDNVTANHLDIGVGTGYFMDKCRFPSPQPRVALMDLNVNSLETTAKRLTRYHPETYKRNVLEPFNLKAPPFDSIGMTHLLHCLPGNMETKGVVFKYAREILNPGGIIFGSTILNKGVRPNPLRLGSLKMINLSGIMTNLDDSVASLKANLQKYFPESAVWTIGSEALFRARK
jgi:ubiquinone/menaquinone biosynthesis C-methylase UbiE